jgi:lycopene cyclase domain-containing protein
MVMPTAYLFIEVGVVVFFLAFCWESRRLGDLRSWRFWRPALALAGFWFLIDETAVALGLWSFPSEGTLPFRIGSLPLEECLLFFVHTLICAMALRFLRIERMP